MRKKITAALLLIVTLLSTLFAERLALIEDFVASW
jgi:hypothetical protein